MNGLNISGTWPFLEESLCFESRDLVEVKRLSGDVVVTAFACGGLTDMILVRTFDDKDRVSGLSCCHDIKTNDPPALGSRMPADLSVDAGKVIFSGNAPPPLGANFANPAKTIDFKGFQAQDGLRMPANNF